MRKIVFTGEVYGGEPYRCLDGIVGKFELLWIGIVKSPYGTRQGEQLSRKEHKVIKGLKKKLKDISIYKDGDQDSRIIFYPHTKECWLENDEYSLLIRLLEANSFSAAVSETLTDLYDLLDDTKEEELTPKLSE